MRLALLIISTAALALATPIIPTMVYDLPSVTTPTDDPIPIVTPIEDPHDTYIKKLFEHLHHMPICNGAGWNPWWDPERCGGVTPQSGS
jgi:hypothetical protein